MYLTLITETHNERFEMGPTFPIGPGPVTSLHEPDSEQYKRLEKKYYKKKLLLCSVVKSSSFSVNAAAKNKTRVISRSNMAPTSFY